MSYLFPVFCYGSLNPTEISERLSVKDTDSLFSLSKRAVLKDHKRVFKGFSKRWEGGTSNAEYCEGFIVSGYIVYLTTEQIGILDMRENVPQDHIREQKIVETADGKEIISLYLSTSEYYNSPTKDYVRAVEDTIRFSKALR